MWKKLQNIEILPDSQLYQEIHRHKGDNERLSVLLNTTYHEPAEVRALLGEITGQKIDASVTISLPFYTDFGKHIRIGKDVFINKGVICVDLGGIKIEDHVLIGPMSRLITVDHLLAPDKRRGLKVQQIIIKKNAWVGANVTILPGVTIGENAVIAADSTVTQDVPANAVVAGTPAKIIKFV